MQRDLRETPLYQEAEALYRALRQPGTGLITDAGEVSTNGAQVAFAGTMVEALKGTPPTRICLTDLATGDTRVLTLGPNVDRLPKFSPDGRRIAFLSDRQSKGDFQLYLLDPTTGAARPTPRVEGWVEYLHWSPDGKRILLGVAGHGADVAGGQGAMRTAQAVQDFPPWIPTVETGQEDHRWRSAWVYDLATRDVRRVSPARTNIWEAAWCGSDALSAIASPGPSEGLWYTARLSRIALASGDIEELYVPRAQLGWVSASPSGARVVVVEAICSDRWIAAGDAKLFDTVSRQARSINTHGVDVTFTEWRSESRLLLAGNRGFKTVVGIYDTVTGRFEETWCSDEVTSGGFCVSISGLDDAGDCVIVGQGFRRAADLGVIRRGEYRTVQPLGSAYAETATSVLDAVERVSWRAPDDGLEIQGWLLRPRGFAAPHPLVMHVHGGPIYHWRPGPITAANLMLLKRGYALFLPNPRGSSGRGQDFARGVVGDIGGADSRDLIAGVDHLIARDLADSARLGVTGGSYGGYMTSWLITQDTRFAAAVSVAPVTNRTSQRLTANHPQFVDLFVGACYTKPGGKYFHRSPIMHAHAVRTPTLNICGALDRCTPPMEAVQFHNALVENNVKSMLVTYPEEGHGIRRLPASVDYAARVVGWFEEHMPAGGAGEDPSSRLVVGDETD